MSGISVSAITASRSARAYYKGTFIALTALFHVGLWPSVDCTLYRVYDLPCAVQPPPVHCTVQHTDSVPSVWWRHIYFTAVQNSTEFDINISRTQLYIKVQSVPQSLYTRVCTTELNRQGLGKPLSKAGWELS